MEELNQLLDCLEANIDLEHAATVEKMHLDALNYRELPYLPLTLIVPPDADGKFKPFPYSEAFDDPEKMLFNELLMSFSSTYQSTLIKDYFPYQIRSNHGLGIINSLFGSRCRIVNDNMPWVDHLEGGTEAVKQLIQKGLPDMKAGLGGKVLETYQFFREKLKEYPRCYQAIHITQPDMQGPFDIAHLFWGTDVFYELYDHPEIIEELLNLVTETYIRFRNFIDPYLTDKAGTEAVYVHGGIFGGKVLLKDDTAIINLSREMYIRFAQPFNQRILTEFGGSIHYCGPIRDWHYEVLEHPRLKSLQYGNPEMHNLEVIMNKWRPQKVAVAFWGYNQDYHFAKQAILSGIKTGMTLAAKVDSAAQASEILKEHTGKS